MSIKPPSDNRNNKGRETLPEFLTVAEVAAIPAFIAGLSCAKVFGTKGRD